MLTSSIVNGFSSSFILLLCSLGLVIIMGYMKVVNLAHTEVLMLGAYICYGVNTVLRLPFIAAVLCAYVLTFLFGVLVERLVICKLYGKMSETLLATYAISIILKQGVRIICGARAREVAIPFEGVQKIGTAILPNYYIFVMLITAAAITGTVLLFHKTVTGRKIRATTQNRTMTECLGIDTRKTDQITFGHGMGLAGLAGAVIAPISSVTPFIGEAHLSDTFINVVMGGVSSLLGTAISSGIIGQSVSAIGRFSDETTAKIIVFLLVIVVIRIKPEGLLATEKR